MPRVALPPARVEHEEPDVIEGLIEDIKDDLSVIRRELDGMLPHQHGSRYHTERVAARDDLLIELEKLRRERTRLAIIESKKGASSWA